MQKCYVVCFAKENVQMLFCKTNNTTPHFTKQNASLLCFFTHGGFATIARSAIRAKPPCILLCKMHQFRIIKTSRTKNILVHKR